MLMCSGTGSAEVQFFKDNNVLSVGFQKYSAHDMNDDTIYNDELWKGKDKYDKFNTLLFINNFTLSDQGDYSCMGRNAGKETSEISDTVTLTLSKFVFILLVLLFYTYPSSFTPSLLPTPPP